MGFHVKYPLFLLYFKETWTFSRDFWSIHKYQISWHSIQLELSCSMPTIGHTDVTKLTVAFHNFVNAPKKTNNSNEYQTNCFDLQALFLLSISMLDTVLNYGWLDVVLTLNSCVQRSFHLWSVLHLKQGPL